MLHASPPPIAFISDLGFQELMLVALASVVIFGRRLPQVAARGFAEFQRLRRMLTQTWRDTGIEDELRRVQRDIDRSLPRDFDPGRIARRETREIERELHRDGQGPGRGGPDRLPSSDGGLEPAPPLAHPEHPTEPPSAGERGEAAESQSSAPPREE